MDTVCLDPFSLMGVGDVLYGQGRCEEAIANYRRALLQAQDAFLKAKLSQRLARAYMRLGQFPEAASFWEQALPALSGLERAEALNDLGVCYFKLGKIGLALAMFEASLVEYRVGGDKRGEALVLLNLGDAHLSLGRYAQAAEAFERSLDLLKRFGSEEELASAYLLLLGAYVGLSRLEEAISLLKEAIEGPLKARAGEGYTLLAILFGMQGKWGEGLAVARKALSLLPEWEFSAIADALRVAGALAAFVGDVQGSIGYYSKALVYGARWEEIRAEVEEMLKYLPAPVADELGAWLCMECEGGTGD